LLIASRAAAHGLAVYSRNPADFEALKSIIRAVSVWDMSAGRILCRVEEMSYPKDLSRARSAGMGARPPPDGVKFDAHSRQAKRGGNAVESGTHDRNSAPVLISAVPRP